MMQTGKSGQSMLVVVGLLPLALLLLLPGVAVRLNEASKEVEHLQIDDSHLIDTNRNNFALTMPALAQAKGWKTVSVNGNKVIIMSAECRKTIKSMGSLSADEQSLLRDAKEQLYQVEWNNENENEDGDGDGQQQGQQVEPVGGAKLQRSASVKFSSDGQLKSLLFANNVKPSSFKRNGAAITKLGDDDISIGRPDFPNKIAMIFIDNDVATFVHRDGRVRMKPISCSEPLEAQLIDQALHETESAEHQSRLKLSANSQHNLQNLILHVLEDE